jgi:glycyl-tRNA synthetase beta chain
MDRELLIEIGCEEIPASWLPGLTTQLARHVDGRLKEHRLVPDQPTEAYSTPRRLAARVVRLAERQTDLEDLVTGPPESAAFLPDGRPTPAAAGFAKKHGVEVSALERHTTPKGTYLAHRVHQRGKATVDVLADVLAGVLRDLTFPKQMRWDAYLDDGKGELVFARPIRWLVLMYGGRVVPFVIRRSELAQGRTVQDVASGSNTHGHRFLTTSGRAGRAIKIKTFEDYKARLLENFVILERSERESRIKRELEAHARRLGGRVSSLVTSQSSLLQEVPDLVEYPDVVAGHFPVEFLALPEEVLTTTMIHHQHYFPVVGEDGKLKPAFLAVTNVQVEKPEVIARNSERVLTARLRDARFFWDEDRKASLASRVDRLSTILFHKKLGSYRDKAERVAALAAWIATAAFGQPAAAAAAEQAGRLCKADLATDMVRELTELQGTMGGIYAREEGLPEAVWRGIYYHYLPIGVEADAPPSSAQLGGAAVTWAAVALADKLDSVVGMFAGGERPTGSRDPLGLRRQAQGVVKILVDLPELTGLKLPLVLGSLLDRAGGPFPDYRAAIEPLHAFMGDRLAYLLEQRGHDVRSVRAVMNSGVSTGAGAGASLTGAVARMSPFEARRKLEALGKMVGSQALAGVAGLLKRVKNISKHVAAPASFDGIASLPEPADQALATALIAHAPTIRAAASRGDYREAFSGIAQLQPDVARFFDDVMVMAEDPEVRAARLQLMAGLRDLIVDIADLSEIAADAQ